MASVPGRYRVVNFIGGRILEARELNQLQDISQGIDPLGNDTGTSYVDEQATYRQGAMLNASISVSGSTITVGPTDNTKPVQVFVRDRWETFTSGELTPVTLSGGQTAMYLNWQIVIITSAQDPTLIDGATSQDTAEMGQLNMQISATDDSTRSPTAGSELYKNMTTIPLCNFTFSSGVYTPVLIDNINSVALANNQTSGLVKLTTSTASGVAVSTDDPRMTDARSPLSSSIVDSSVRTPVSPGGTNSDGTPVYNLTSDIGGINATKIILTATTQLLSDAWSSFKAAFNALLTRYNAHEGIILGLSNTHPFPTPSQVGAAPLSHVGLPLNLPTSHPATVTQSSGGFVLNRPNPGPGGSPMDPGYGILDGSTLVAGLNHDGDIYSSAAQTISAAPGGSGVTYGGPLGLNSRIALVLAQHVNQTSHANPHGLAIGDIGGQPNLGFTPVQQGTGVGQLTNTVKLGWTGANLAATVDSTNLGNFLFSDSFPTSLSPNGFIEFPGGLIMQWCTGNQENTNQTTFQSGNWPINFPNALLGAFVSTNWISNDGGTDSDIMIYQISSSNANGWTVRHARGGQYAQTEVTSPTLFAIGF